MAQSDHTAMSRGEKSARLYDSAAAARLEGWYDMPAYAAPQPEPVHAVENLWMYAIDRRLQNVETMQASRLEPVRGVRSRKEARGSERWRRVSRPEFLC